MHVVHDGEVAERPSVKYECKALGQPFSVGNDRFIASPPSKPVYCSYQGPPSYVTVILVFDAQQVSEEWLRKTIENYKTIDDVFRNEFLTGVIFAAKRAELEVTATAQNLLRSLGNGWIEIHDLNLVDSVPAPGPYMTNGRELLEVFRLYDDTQGAFMTGLISDADAGYKELCLSGAYPQTCGIAVPSRLQRLSHTEKPLAGLRVAAKDIFRIKGVRTSLCNRAYYQLYPPAIETAGCIRILVEKGASLVGTTRLSSFAATEEPLECVDFQAPWNPRADGYQSPAGSGSGSGVAIASYSWLDIAIGSDTSGSGRRPGHWNGCYAMRPTHGVLSVDGYIPSFRQFDVPTFFGRDLTKCRHFANHWYGHGTVCAASKKSVLIYPTDYMALITNSDQIKVIDDFVADLEVSLGVKHRKVSFEAVWATSPPQEARGEDFHEYMKDACRDSFFHDDYHNFDQFRAEYYEKYSKAPYVSPPVRRQWKLSATITQSARDIAVARLEVYRNWLLNTILKASTADSIVLIPIENISQRYRDEAISDFCPVGVPMLFLSPILGGPELSIPIGQVPFFSKITGKSEALPVSISLLAAPGQDLNLFDCALSCLQKSGRPTTVCAGNKLFGVSE